MAQMPLWSKIVDHWWCLCAKTAVWNYWRWYFKYRLLLPIFRDLWFSKLGAAYTFLFSLKLPFIILLFSHVGSLIMLTAFCLYRMCCSCLRFTVALVMKVWVNQVKLLSFIDQGKNNPWWYLGHYTGSAFTWDVAWESVLNTNAVCVYDLTFHSDNSIGRREALSVYLTLGTVLGTLHSQLWIFMTAWPYWILNFLSDASMSLKCASSHASCLHFTFPWLWTVFLLKDSIFLGHWIILSFLFFTQPFTFSRLYLILRILT
jgi:hypothetical protein